MTNQHFTSFERDPASVNDNASHRFYVNRLGRFSAVDPVLGGGASPQRFNLYSYTGNDPVNRWDPSGRDYICFPSFVIEDWDPFDVIGYDPDPFWFPCEDGSGGGEGGGGSCNPDSLEGNSCPPPVPVPPPPPPPPAPECFCQMKHRSVRDYRARLIHAQHNLWYVQDASGTQYFLEGGPSNRVTSSGFLEAYQIPYPGGPGDVSSTPSFTAGPSAAACYSASLMEAATDLFPPRANIYNPVTGPNSNSLAHYLAHVGGFNPQPPLTSPGWKAPLVIIP